jgi:RNA 3'-terminal phosphate cyclase
LKDEYKKPFFTPVPTFFGGDTAFHTSGGNSIGIVLEPIMVLAITSSETVHFISYWA